MKPLLAATALSLALASGAAIAGQCPVDMSKIDAALAENPQLSADQMSKVKELRARGEELHKTGKHGESVRTLGQAKDILGID